jgi:hypothetical protein
VYRRAAQDIVIFCASIGVVKVVAPKRAGVAATFSDGWDVQNEYFRLYALKNDRLSIGKTFVAFDKGEGVVGYMTLASAQVESRSLPEEMRAKLPRQALEKALSVSAEVGLYAVIVDAIDDKARGFYLKYGFEAFSEYPLTLFLPLATVAEAHP